MEIGGENNAPGVWNFLFVVLLQALKQYCRFECFIHQA